MAEGCVPMAREWQRALGLQVCCYSSFVCMSNPYTLSRAQQEHACTTLPALPAVNSFACCLFAVL